MFSENSESVSNLCREIYFHLHFILFFSVLFFQRSFQVKSVGAFSKTFTACVPPEHHMDTHRFTVGRHFLVFLQRILSPTKIKIASLDNKQAKTIVGGEGCRDCRKS